MSRHSLARLRPSAEPTRQILGEDGPDLLDYFVREALVHREDWAKVPDEVRASLEATKEPRELLSGLVSNRLLTEYQADRIAAGTVRGLRLGNYRVLDRLGAGGMGIVFLGEHVQLRRPVAIKVLPLNADDEPGTLLSRFFDEIRIVAQLQHPNIVWALDTGDLPPDDPDEPTLFYHVMEYVPGNDLEDVVKGEGPLSVFRACDVVYQVASALAEADKHHLVHRDIKPSNIMVTPEGQAKLLDFGLVRTLGQRHTHPGAIIGSVEYMAPEQVQDASAVDIRADIYSLGGTLFWSLAGKVPFPADAPMTHLILQRVNAAPPSLAAARPGLPAGLGEVVARMMATRPQDRYQSPAAVMRALLPFLKDESGEFRHLSGRQAVAVRPAAGQGPDVAAGPRALIVDDEDGVRGLLRIVLEAQGVACIEARDGAEALDTLRAQPVDVVLLDVDMPGLSGPEVLRRVREEPPAPNLKVIMLSGRVGADDMSGLVLAGADDFMSKPFSVVQLNARVKGALRLKAAQDRSDGLLRRLMTENAQAELTLQGRETDVADARGAMVRALAELVAYRKAETPARLERMQAYVGAFARRLAALPGFAPLLDEPFVQTLVAATPLHDAGMLGLPEHILLKPGKLTRDEWIIMQSHTTIAADVLHRVARQHCQSAAFLQMAIDVCRHHHERWDGRGYPDGLAGGDIPLAARIVAFADVYDALRARRPYKPALSHAAAVEVMIDPSAGQFDPAMLQAFQDCHDRFEQIHRNHPD